MHRQLGTEKGANPMDEILVMLEKDARLMPEEIAKNLINRMVEALNLAR